MGAQLCLWKSLRPQPVGNKTRNAKIGAYIIMHLGQTALIDGRHQPSALMRLLGGITTMKCDEQRNIERPGKWQGQRPTPPEMSVHHSRWLASLIAEPRWINACAKLFEGKPRESGRGGNNLPARQFGGTPAKLIGKIDRSQSIKRRVMVGDEPLRGQQQFVTKDKTIRRHVSWHFHPRQHPLPQAAGRW